MMTPMASSRRLSSPGSCFPPPKQFSCLREAFLRQPQEFDDLFEFVHGQLPKAMSPDILLSYQCVKGHADGQSGNTCLNTQEKVHNVYPPDPEMLLSS